MVKNIIRLEVSLDTFSLGNVKFGESERKSRKKSFFLFRGVELCRKSRPEIDDECVGFKKEMLWGKRKRFLFRMVFVPFFFRQINWIFN